MPPPDGEIEFQRFHPIAPAHAEIADNTDNFVPEWAQYLNGLR